MGQRASGMRTGLPRQLRQPVGEGPGVHRKAQPDVADDEVGDLRTVERTVRTRGVASAQGSPTRVNAAQSAGCGNRALAASCAARKAWAFPRPAPSPA